MSRRPPAVAGVVLVATGALLLTLGLGPGGGEVRAAASNPAPASVGANEASVDTVTGGVLASAALPSTPPVKVAEGASAARASGGRSQSTPRSPADPDSTPRASSDVTLAVSSIGLDVPVQAGGAGSSGTVVPPAGRAMWVRGHGRVAPGDIGTAVVAGHVASFGDDDVFADLSSIRVGHTVVITSGSVSRSYVVRRASVVTKSALTRDADVWGPNDSRRRVVLVTCDDDLGYRSDGHRVANFVVVADAT